ncbi:hypothetical protein WS57_28125 [Burkholderia pseudomultivorans]|nr:hypothetical protein WS57_28125 [Burkholderia pseudomultivorans]
MLEVQVKAFVVALHEGTASAVGLAVEPVPFPMIVLAACVAWSASVTSPVAVKLPVTVGEAIVGDAASTTDPDPVEAVKLYVPAPVLLMKPVDAKPVMLSSAVPLAEALFVPPDATGIGGLNPLIVPPVIAACGIVAVPLIATLLYVGLG